jgi:very-short-patch-repair endonuclease
MSKRWSGRWRGRVAGTVAGCEVDALWPDHRVIAELDGWANHSGRSAAGRDREQTNRLQLHGFTVLRFMHGDVTHRPGAVAATVAAALTASRT